MAERLGYSNSDAPVRPAISESGKGLVRVQSNQTLNEIDKIKREDEKHQNKPEISGLAAYLWTLWEAAKNAKWSIDERLARCIRQRKGVYEPDDLAAIREFGGSEVFMMLTNVKTRAIEAQIKDILLPAGEKPWAITSTPMPDLPNEVVERVVNKLEGELMMIIQTLGQVPITPEMIDMRLGELMDESRAELKQLANKECELAEQQVEDILVEGDFYDELADFIKDFSTYLTAFLRGPFVTHERRLVWKQDMDGKSYPDYELQPVVRFRRVSPFDMYPAPAARSLSDGYNFERMRIRPSELVKFRESPGFSPSAVDATILDHRAGMITNWLWTDQERANIENRPQEITDPTSMIECLLFSGDIPGRYLREWGLKYEGSIADPVEVQAMICNNRVLMLRVNTHPLQWKPYYYASFDPSADSIWGTAPPELMEDCQRMCNSTARALSNNVAMASGPQVEVFGDRLNAPESPQRIWPWKVWKTNSDPTGSGKPAVQFFQPALNARELMQVFDFFYSQAGEQLGIPAYEHGVESQGSGAGKTAHGLAMLMTAASKIMKDAIGYIDRQVIKKVIFQVWLYAITSGIMEYEGDINIVARASEYLIIAEQLQARRQEFLAFTNNPVDLQIIGMDGRAQVLRETVKSLKMDSDDIVPPNWQLQAEMGAMMDPNAVAPGMPAGGGPQPGEQVSEKPIAGEPHEEPIGGAPPAIPLEQMAQM